jgi:RNA polymerase sigma-70 factor (ECF subfamily)
MTQAREATPGVRTDAELVALVLEGRRELYGELVRRHQAVLYRHMRGMGIEHDTSLDLVQDAFVKACLRLVECRERGHFRAWVFRIARNLCLDYLKSVRRQTIPFSAFKSPADLPSDDSPDYELRNLLRRALTNLPLVLREAFLLKHDADYTYDEIAEMTDVSPSAIKMRVQRARTALRTFLAARGVHAA